MGFWNETHWWESGERHESSLHAWRDSPGYVTPDEERHQEAVDDVRADPTLDRADKPHKPTRPRA